MKIDTHNGWFKGLGDIVCFAWIGATLHAAGAEVQFYAHGWRAEVLRCFQQRVTEDAAGAVTPQIGYEMAVHDKSTLNYLEWIAAQCETGRPGGRATGKTEHPLVLHSTGSGPERVEGVSPCLLVRPRLDLPPMEREMGRQASARVLVFPEGAWPARVWPRNYYLELCRLLKDAGIDLAVVTEKRAEDFGALRCIHDQSLAFVAAAMQNASLVIGNDSGPAHLAGTIGTRTLAIQGPTTERIFAHLPEVTSLRKKALDCAGCHCLPWASSGPAGPGYAAGWRDSCALGCHELYRTFPEDVFQAAMKLLVEKGEGREAKGDGLFSTRTTV